MKRIVLVLSVSILTGCLNNPLKDFKPVAEDTPAQKVRCEPYLYPNPLNFVPLKAKSHFLNKGTHREVTHDGWAIVLSWIHEAYRYVADVQIMMKDVEDCILKFNQVTATLAKSTELDPNTP